MRLFIIKSIKLAEVIDEKHSELEFLSSIRD